MQISRTLVYNKPKLFLNLLFFTIFFTPCNSFCEEKKDIARIILELEKNPFTDSTLKLLTNINLTISAKEEPQKKAKILLTFIEVLHAKNEYIKADSILESLRNIVQTFHLNSIEPFYYLHKGKNDQLRYRVSGVMENYHKAFQLFSQQNDTNGMVKTHVFFGEFFRKQENFVMALKHLGNGRELVKRCKISVLVKVLMLNRIAAVYSELSNPDSSLHYSLLALKYANESGLSHYQAISLNEIGYMYENMNDKTGISYYSAAEKIWNTLGLDRYKANAMLNRGRFLNKLGLVDESIVVNREIITLAENQEWPEISGPVNELLGDIYFKKNKYKEAFIFMKTGGKIQYDYYKKLHDEKALEINALYESDENKNLLELSNQELDSNRKMLEKEKELNSRRMYIVIFSGIIIIAMLVVGCKLKIFPYLK